MEPSVGGSEPPRVRPLFVVGYALVLAVLTIAVSDFITGGVPVLPASLALLFLIPAEPVFYGVGMLLVRETVLRWRKGWFAVLLLGGALGLVTEGLFTKVLFAPESYAVVGPAGAYGSWLGVNWILAAEAFLFHGALTTAIPLFLIGRIFPRVERTPFAPGRKLWVLLGLFALVVATVYVFVPIPGSGSGPVPFAYSPAAAYVFLVFDAVVVLAYLAWRIPDSAVRPVHARPSVGPVAFGVLGLAFSGSLLLLAGLGPTFAPGPVFLMVGFVLLGLVSLVLLRRWLGQGDNTVPEAALVIGALLPYCVVAGFLTAMGDLGALPVAIALVALGIYSARRPAASPMPPAGAV